MTTLAQERLEQRWRVYTRDGGLCGICHHPVGFGEMHLDHIVPHVAGGTDDDNNLQPAHSGCNVRAYTKGHPRRRRPTLTAPRAIHSFRFPRQFIQLLRRAKEQTKFSCTKIVILAVEDWGKERGVK